MRIREIYCKLPTDLDYEAKVESTDEAANILQQIKVVLGTKPGEVLGNPMFGCDLEKYLFSMNYNKEEILQMINYEIFLMFILMKIDGQQAQTYYLDIMQMTHMNMLLQI